MVVWESYASAGTDTSELSVQAQRFNSDGSVSGSEFQVNNYTTGYQVGPDMAGDGNGNLLAVWTGGGSPDNDSDLTSVQARLYTTGLVFIDGFESGGTLLWSDISP